MLASRITAVASALVLAACAGTPWSGKSHCRIEGPEASAPGHEKWVRLLLRGYDPESRRVTEPALDCTDARVLWSAPAAACFDNPLVSTLLPGRPLGEADVVVSPVSDRVQIVWVVTNRFASGDGLGPAAVVEKTGDGLAVRAIGALRGYTDRASLRIEWIGKSAVLVAEGRLCSSADPAACVRSARVMPLRGDRFAQEPLFSDRGVCVSPAWFDLTRRDVDGLPSGWMRRKELSASLVFGPQGMRVEELLVVSDVDPKQPGSQPRPFRRAQGDRTVTAAGPRLVVTGRSVWSEVAGGK